MELRLIDRPGRALRPLPVGTAYFDYPHSVVVVVVVVASPFPFLPNRTSVLRRMEISFPYGSPQVYQLRGQRANRVPYL